VLIPLATDVFGRIGHGSALELRPYGPTATSDAAIAIPWCRLGGANLRGRTVFRPWLHVSSRTARLTVRCNKIPRQFKSASWHQHVYPPSSQDDRASH